MLYRIKCTRQSSRNEKPLAQSNETALANLDTAVNLDTNPSYHFTVSSNDQAETNYHEYYDMVNENHTVEANSPYLDIVEEATKLHCKNMAYVGSTK